MFDVVLRGGWVVDGTGAPPVRADVAVDGDRVAALGRLDHAAAGTDLDVSGRYVLPGLVDAHAHADALAGTADVHLAALRQGVTTLVLGQDGLSFAPGSATTVAAISRYFGPVNGPCPPELAEGCGVGDLLRHHDGASALNVAYLVPAGTVRADVVGFTDAPSDDDQLARMRTAVERGLAEGAVGLSTGLEYVPGCFAGPAELAALCAPVAAAGRVHVTHMRGYEANAWRGLAEVTEVSRRSAVATHVSHLHGPAHMITALVDAARADGVDLTFDTYPYLRGATILAMVALPVQLQRHGPDEMLRRLRDPDERARLARDWFPAVDDVLDRVRLSYVASPDWSWAEGMSLREAAAAAALPVGELVCELVTASELGVGCVFAQPPTNTEADVRALLRHEAHLAGSDAIMLGSRPHPRGWGTFARLMGRHTRELGDWAWGEASVHLAGHAARRFGLAGRGVVRRGAFADLAVVDPAVVTDRADYADPRRPADGVDHVLVNGTLALRDGALTGATSGRGLRWAEAA